MKMPAERFTLNLTRQDREIVGRLARRLDLNFREAIRTAIRNEYARVRQAPASERGERDAG